MRVLVTGAGGQVGRELVRVFGADAVGFERAALDVADRDAVVAAVASVRPDVVVNAAAWTEVDACESDEARAFAVNARAVGHLADACRETGARLVQISTDYVFDGTKDGPYVEDDLPNPLSVYGRSKWAGEEEAGDRALVVRTSWVNGRHGPSMVATVLRLAEGSGELRFVDDQIGHPTFADELAGAIGRLVTDGCTGVFHVTNQRAVSWFEFAQEVLRAAGHDPARVRPVSTSEMPRPAPRPANSVLDNAALREAGLPLLGDFSAPLARLVAELT